MPRRGPRVPCVAGMGGVRRDVTSENRPPFERGRSALQVQLSATFSFGGWLRDGGPTEAPLPATRRHLRPPQAGQASPCSERAVPERKWGGSVFETQAPEGNVSGFG